MGPFAPKMNDKHWDRQAAIDCVKSWQFWAFAVTYFSFVNSLNAFGCTSSPSPLLPRCWRSSPCSPRERSPDLGADLSPSRRLFPLAHADFAPTIIASLKFKGPMAQLLTVPPNVFGAIVIIANAIHSDRTKERPMHVVFGASICGIGWVILAVVRNWGVRYFGVFLIACTNSAVIPLYVLLSSSSAPSSSSSAPSSFVLPLPLLTHPSFRRLTSPSNARLCTSVSALLVGLRGFSSTQADLRKPPIPPPPSVAFRTATVSGSTATAIATAGVIAISNSAGAVAPFLFPATDGPLYIKGNWTCFAFMVLGSLITLVLWYFLGGSSEYKGSESFVGVAGENGLEIEKGDEEAAKGKEFGAGARQ